MVEQARARRDHRVMCVLPGLMLVTLLGALDQTIIAPALPSMAGEFGGLDQAPTVVTAYLLAATVTMPLYGKFGDRFGRKPALLVAIGAFVVGAVLCALAQSMPVLVVARVIQGAGGGGLTLSAQAILGEIVSPRERGRYLGLLGSMYILASVGGPLVGGFLIDQLSWRWIFAFYPPLALLAAVMLMRTLRLPAPRTRSSIDYAGAATLTTAVIGLTLLVSTGAGAGWIVAALGAVTAAAIVTWLVTARTAKDPIIPLRLFRDRAFTICTAISFVIGFALLGVVTYLPSFLQIGMDTSPTQAGLAVTSLMAGVLVTMTGSGRLISRTGRYKAFPVAGTAITALSLVLFSRLDTDASMPVVIACIVLFGMGIGFVMQVVITVAQNAVGHADLGTATSAVTFVRQIGATVGAAVVGTVITVRFKAGLPADAVDRFSGTLSPEDIAGLPAPAQQAVAGAFGNAVPTAFGYVAPLFVLAFLLALALPARTLGSTAHVDLERTP